MFKSHLFSIKFLLLANLCTLFDISLSETQKIISKEIPNNTQNSKSSKSICDEHSQCFVSETNINRFRIKDNYVYVGAVNQIFKVGRLKMKHLTGKTTGPVYQSQCYKLPFDIRRNLSPKTTVRSKIMVRVRNLVIFEVFGVKFSVKKSIFWPKISFSNALYDGR